LQDNEDDCYEWLGLVTKLWGATEGIRNLGGENFLENVNFEDQEDDGRILFSWMIWRIEFVLPTGCVTTLLVYTCLIALLCHDRGRQAPKISH
jgi:hypothetical protein